MLVCSKSLDECSNFHLPVLKVEKSWICGCCHYRSASIGAMLVAAPTQQGHYPQREERQPCLRGSLDKLPEDLPEPKWEAGCVLSLNSHEMGRYVREKGKPRRRGRRLSHCLKHRSYFAQSEHSTSAHPCVLVLGAAQAQAPLDLASDCIQPFRTLSLASRPSCF